jgi:hypothetical protein
MKIAVLLTAMLSGLCAEAMAVPFGILTSQADRDDAFTHPVTERHFSLNSLSAPEALFEDEDDPDPGDLNFESAIGNYELAIDGNGSFLFRHAPEPPPLTMMAVGLSCIGIFALCRRIMKKKRSVRRRKVVRLRAIFTAER